MTAAAGDYAGSLGLLLSASEFQDPFLIDLGDKKAMRSKVEDC